MKWLLILLFAMGCIAAGCTAPVVYDPPVDKSDANAKKDFDDLTIRAMKISFHDEGTYYDPSGNMAPEPPYEGDYAYDVVVAEDDGTARVSSSFCREITLSGEKVEKLQALVREANLGALNGLDVHTEGLPRNAAGYALELTLASGEVIRSSANSESVPENWRLDEGIFSFDLHTGHMNTLGLGESGYGKYDTIRYRIDAQTGRLLPLSNLFTSADALTDYLSGQMKRGDGTFRLQGCAPAAADFPAALKAAVSLPESEGGVGWNASENHLTLYFPTFLFQNVDSQLFTDIYYDDMQDILGDAYTRLR